MTCLFFFFFFAFFLSIFFSHRLFVWSCNFSSLFASVLHTPHTMIPGEIRQRKGASLEDVGPKDEDDGEVKKFVKKFDFNPKLTKQVETQSLGGGVVSLLMLLVTFWLLFSEYRQFSERADIDVVAVDTEREKPDELIKVYLEIEFPELPCAVLALDAVDGEGDQQPHAKAHVVRSRMQGTKEIGHFGQPVLGSEVITSSKWVPPKGYCGSCYDINKLAKHSTACCNTCIELKRAYISHGLDPRVASNSEQCLREATAPKLVSQNEGCRVHGHLEVQPSVGNFHVAAGRGIQASHQDHQHHLHQLSSRDLLTFNVSHRIKLLSFGRPMAQFDYPLEGVEHIDQQLTQVMYYMSVVPITLLDSSGTEQSKSFVYSASQIRKPIDLTSAHFPVPGVFFQYDFSALQINRSNQSPSLLQFITRVCAVIGGMYVVLGFVYHSLDYLLTKILGFEEGKVSSLL